MQGYDQYGIWQVFTLPSGWVPWGVLTAKQFTADLSLCRFPAPPHPNPQGTGQASGLSSKPTGRAGRTRQSKARRSASGIRFPDSQFSTPAGEPPVALGVLRDETAEEWERVALMQDGSMSSHCQTTFHKALLPKIAVPWRACHEKRKSKCFNDAVFKIPRPRQAFREHLRSAVPLLGGSCWDSRRLSAAPAA